MTMSHQPTILITGGAGYIGSHVIEQLRGRYPLVIVDNFSTGSRSSLAALGVQAEELDIGDRAALSTVFDKHRIDAVIHLAGSLIIEESVRFPERYMRNNVLNGATLLEVMREHDVRSIIFSSSAAVYGQPERLPVHESHIVRPKSIYGLTKLLFEQLLDHYTTHFDFRSVSLRYFNAAGASTSGRIGELPSARTRLIPSVLRAALEPDTAMHIFGDDYPTPDGTGVRDFIHVSDLAEAHALALDALLAGTTSTTYNLGNGRGFSVRDVIHEVETVSGRSFRTHVAPRRTGDLPELVASSEKARSELGWNPQYPDLRSIVSSSYTWYHKRLSHDIERAKR